jgi:sugar lactone lactonase YvrE
MSKKLLVLFIFVIAAAQCFSMDRTHFLELDQKGRELKKKQDWPGMLQILIEIGKEMPAITPTYALRMASVETHLGNKAAALQWMERYAAMGLTYDLAGDDDLKPLLSEAGWKKIAAQMEQHAAQVMHADEVCTLPIVDLMPEDITFDKTSGTFIVSSIQHHSLYRVSLPKGSDSPKGSKVSENSKSDCEAKELPLEAQAKHWPVMAVSFDPARKLVWMTLSAMPGFSGFPKEDDGKTALLAVDPRDGKVVRRFDLEAGGPAVLGDMSVTADGTVYVSDSLGGGVYRVAGNANLEKAKLEKIADGLFSPQTPVLAADGKRLLVPEYPLGIAVIDLTGTGNVTELRHPDNVAVTALDGMHLVGDSLIGVQNGTEPEHIVRFRLNHAQTEIESAEVIEQSTPRLGEPTHAIAVDGWVYVLANVGWDKIDDRGKLKEGASFTSPVLLRFLAKGAGRSPEKGASTTTK